VLKVILIDRERRCRELDALPGESVLQIARKYGLDIEGRCEGSLACSTCHVVIDPLSYHKLPAPSEEEQDMLDTVASGLSATSRLGCQVRISSETDQMTITLPMIAATTY
jgi:2Fe-2S ferredoxin